jgi:uncharacterized membrane protein YphA (DoxX/SURF4 family)
MPWYNTLNSVQMEFLLKGRTSWPLQIIVWAFVFYISWQLASKGYGKIMNPQAMFNYPVWLMLTVGIIELFAPLLMFIPRLSFYSAAPVAVVMLVASYHETQFKEVSGILEYIQLTPTIVAFLSLIIMFIMRPSYLRKQKKITKISI